MSQKPEHADEKIGQSASISSIHLEVGHARRPMWAVVLTDEYARARGGC